MSNPDQYTDADLAEYEAELNDIATDPNLTGDEKLDALTNAVVEEINDITDSTATTATKENSVTDPTTTATPATESATSDVVGDPATATYTTSATATATATTSTTATATTEVEVESTPAEQATEPAPAADDTPEVNATIGVNGNVDYYSPRDVDRDGNVDVIHSRVDGIDTITHVDDDGAITLVEQDTDFNGTYESATAVRADGTIRVAEDKDDDGAVDLVTYHDPATGQPIRQDEIDGARITDSKFDTDGDGQPDVHLVDSDGNGRFDSAAVDTDADGIVNATLVDTDGDGAFDLVSSDDDNDGTQESYMTSNENGVGSLGDISTYESLIPSDDSYHAQAGADAYEPPASDEIPGDLA